jgi:hypothetical protein
VVTSLKTMEHSDAGGSAVIPWILITVVVFGSLLAAIWLRPTDQDQISGFHGVTGGLLELQNLANQLHAVFASDSDGITHTSNIMLVNPNAEFVGYFSVPHRPEVMARALGELM